MQPAAEKRYAFFIIVDGSMLSGKAKHFLDNFASECIVIPVQPSY
jgi:hypothetical protein